MTWPRPPIDMLMLLVERRVLGLAGFLTLTTGAALDRARLRGDVAAAADWRRACRHWGALYARRHNRRGNERRGNDLCEGR